MSASNRQPSARHRRLVGVGLVAVLSAALVGVAVVRSGGEKVLNSGEDTVVLVDKQTDTVSDGTSGGVLTTVGGCLGWDGADGAPGTIVIWPNGTNLETPDPLRVNIDGKTYRLGDTIRIGGSDIGPLAASSYFYDRVPEGCRAADVWLADNG